jgi:hypothetical protein
MTMLGPTLPIKLLQQSKICPSSVFHIRRTRQTSPPVFGPLKEVMGGKSFRSDEEVQQAVHEWPHSHQKLFFLEVSMHYQSAGTLVWNAMETTIEK